MTYVSQDNQNLIWELIAESNLLHTVSDRIPMIQQHFQSILMKYQFQTMNLTEKNKLTIVDIYPEDSKTYNPAFDITPKQFITKLITNKGIVNANINQILNLKNA